MSDTTTPILGLDKPAIGASRDTWGSKINGDLDLIDANVLPLAGGTVTGNLTVNGTSQLTAINGTDIVASGAVTANYLRSTAGAEVDGNLAVNGTTTLTGTVTTNAINGTSLTASSTVQAAYVHSTGNANVDGRMTTDSVMSSSGMFYVANNTNYYLGHSGSTWSFVENTVTNATLDINGNFNARGTLAGTFLHLSSNFGVQYNGTTGHYIAFGWDGTHLQVWVSGGYVGTVPTLGAMADMAATIETLTARIAALEARG